MKNRVETQSLANGRQRVRIVTPSGGSGTLQGTYDEVREALEDALASLTPPPDRREQLERIVWDHMIDVFRRRFIDEWGTGTDGEGKDVNEVTAEVVAIELGVDEWENGYFPSHPTFLDAEGHWPGGDVTDDGSVIDDGLFNGECIAELRELAGGYFDRWYSYTINRPTG